MNIFQAREFDNKIENYLSLQMDSLFLVGNDWISKELRKLHERDSVSPKRLKISEKSNGCWQCISNRFDKIKD